MQIDNAEDAFVLILQRDPVADCPEIIAEMQIAGRLHAGENTVHGALLSPRSGAGQAGCRRSRLRRARQSAMPSASAKMANVVSPAPHRQANAVIRIGAADVSAGARAERISASTNPL